MRVLSLLMVSLLSFSLMCDEGEEFTAVDTQEEEEEDQPLSPWDVLAEEYKSMHGQATFDEEAFLEKLTQTFRVVNALAEPGSFASYDILIADSPLELPHLSPSQKYHNAFDQLKGVPMFLEQSDVLDRKSQEDLTIVSHRRQRVDDTVVGYSFPTQTSIGQAVLAHMLSNPLTHTKAIAKRATFVRRLIEDDALFATLDQIVRALKKEEDSLLSMPSKFDDFATYKYERFEGVSGGNVSINDFFSKGFFYLSVLGYSAAALGTGYLAIKNRQLLKDIVTIAGSVILHVIKEEPRILPIIPILTILPIYLYIFEKKQKVMENYLERRMLSLFTLTQAVRTVSMTLKKGDMPDDLVAALAGGKQEIKVGDNFVTKNEVLFELNEALDEADLQAGADGGIRPVSETLFACQGRLVDAWQKSFRSYQTALSYLPMLGLIDAYMAIARTIREAPERGRAYCFAEFAAAQQPTLIAENVFHPLIKKDEVVKNTVTLGGTKKQRNLVISGVNAGGKSTIMRTLALATVLAQSFGIAPATRFVCTPFSKIKTSFSVQDNVAKEASLFKAELIRMGALLASASDTHKKQSCIIFADEICRATEKVEGQALAAAFTKMVGQIPNAMLVLATHFPKVIAHAAANKDLFKMMYVRAISKGAPGEFSYTYKLEEGVSSQQIAIDLISKRAIPDFVIKKVKEVQARTGQE